MSPVGRLDFRTEGLLLLTNDGELSYKLCRPEYHVPREYQVLLDTRLSKEQEQIIRKGVELEDGPVKNVKITFVHGTNMGVSTGAWYVITVHEGRNRLVRRLFEHFNRRVVRLIRVAFGDIRLPVDLPSGEYRQLTAEEVTKLRQATDVAVDKATSPKISKARKRALRKPLSARPKDNTPKMLSSKARRPKPTSQDARPAANTKSKSPAPVKTSGHKSKSTQKTQSSPSRPTKSSSKARHTSKPAHKKSGPSRGGSGKSNSARRG